MEELRIDDRRTKEIFVRAFAEGDLVPILGAGFTVGMSTKSRETVPSGKQFKQYMIKQILKLKSDIHESEMKNETFSSVAELFESNFTDIKNMGVSDYFYAHLEKIGRYFIQMVTLTKEKILAAKKSFIKCMEMQSDL